MPSEHPTTHVQQQPDPVQQQIKVCASCHRPLALDNAPAAFFPEDLTEGSNVCTPCRNRLLNRCIDSPARGQVLFAQVEQELLRRAAALQPPALDDHQTLLPSSMVNPRDHSHGPPPRCPDQDVDMRPADLAPLAPTALPSPRPLHAHDPQQQPRPARPPLTLDASSPQAPVYAHAAASPVAVSPWASTSRAPFPHPPSAYPDPLTDITRLRVRSQGHHCLYPGATFKGTQKSGRNSYDVNVTIVDVDFAASHLCGYLRIRGLTDDWPELTTYFDAEIIGARHGFLTRNWGATEQEDMVHWARFPAFRHVRHELQKPHLTMCEKDRWAVFMRWKEKFLVPDHRVQDISGASFAGFYYVCVDFNPQHTASAAAPALAPSELDPLDEYALPKTETEADFDAAPSLAPESLTRPEVTDAHVHAQVPPESPRARRMSGARSGRRGARSASRDVGMREAGAGAGTGATMSGFYFHQNSEPCVSCFFLRFWDETGLMRAFFGWRRYQQLSLVHVPEHTSTSFEFR
ncbi:hypothetical protein EIP86_004087 [Pleurotus ostreatoroseus]|nr:hypothetical protein EIP86_004087 [Pleurotus ostreatoroseus]